LRSFAGAGRAEEHDIEHDKSGGFAKEKVGG